jgi:hypothetical protein
MESPVSARITNVGATRAKVFFWNSSSIQSQQSLVPHRTLQPLLGVLGELGELGALGVQKSAMTRKKRNVATHALNKLPVLSRMQ